MKKEAGRLRFLSGTLELPPRGGGSAQHRSCKVLGSNRAARLLFWRPTCVFSLRADLVPTWACPVILDDADITGTGVDPTGLPGSDTKSSLSLLTIPCLTVLLHLFSCFCRYFLWLTFRLDLTGLSSASLMLLEAISTKLRRLDVASSPWADVFDPLPWPWQDVGY